MGSPLLRTSVPFRERRPRYATANEVNATDVLGEVLLRTPTLSGATAKTLSPSVHMAEQTHEHGSSEVQTRHR